MNEYEYSFKVESIKPYLDYCIKNNYEKESEVIQNRIVYENKHTKDIIARITKKIIDQKEEIIFDIKNVGKRDDKLKDSVESLPLVLINETEKVINSMIKVLDFYEAANNYRIRYVYKKNNVKFEIDDYIQPKMQVIGIEGNKIQVDKVYKDLIDNKIGNILEDE